MLQLCRGRLTLLPCALEMHVDTHMSSSQEDDMLEINKKFEDALALYRK